MNNILRTLIAAVALLSTAAAENAKLTGEIRVRTHETLNSKTAQPGKVWDGSVAADVVRDGQVVVRRGTAVEGVIDEIRSRKDGVARLAVRLTSIDGKAVEAGPHETVGAVSHKAASRTVPGWAITGALVGGILHGGRGAVVGAAAGAGVGGLRAAATQREEANIPAETILQFQLR